jgi:lysine 6-dehydrogenase
MSGPHEGWGIGGRALGTGVPASLGAQWLGQGKIKEKGVLPPEECIDSGRFLHDLGERGRGIRTYAYDGKSRKQL